ncbi:HK97-gp10 family putative phage morphogenesis protein [Ralstonia pseudosolanacearum]
MLKMTGDLLAAIDALEADVVEGYVVRPVAHAGALVFYEEARALAPIHRGPAQKQVRPGQLKNAIYRVFNRDKPDSGHASYSISWNAVAAPHGHLIENGHWLVKKQKGRKRRIRWVPAQSFIRRAFDRAPAAVEAMQRRAREKVAEVLKKTIVDDFGNEVEVGGGHDG